MSNWLQNVERLEKEARYEGAQQERSIWYHGAQGRNLQSILSNGLIPNPKKRSWGTDPNANHTSPSMASIGGVYVTKNLLTALSSSWRGRGNDESQVLVVMELQPRSLIADEDDLLAFSVSGAVPSPYLALQAFMSREIGGNLDYYQYQRDRYVSKALEMFDHRFTDSHPELRRRFEQIINDGWDVALNRQVAHAGQDFFEVKKSFWSNTSREMEQHINQLAAQFESSGLQKDEAYAKALGQFMPKVPDIAAAEKEYADYSDALTRTLKGMPRMKAFIQSGRSMEPIGFSGSNRIVAIVEAKHRNGYKVRLAYGQLPEDFKEQWAERVGPIEMVDSFEDEKELSMVASSQPGKRSGIEVQQVVRKPAMSWLNRCAMDDVGRVAEEVIRRVWMQEYFSDPEVKYCSEEVVLVAENEEPLLRLMSSLGEDRIEEVKETIARRLAELEDRVFKRRRGKLKDEMSHVREIIRGKTWNKAKAEVVNMQPGKRTYGPREVPSDDLAEASFARLYGTAHAPGFGDVEQLKMLSPYMDKDGNRYMKRLSELKNNGIRGASPANREATELYNEANLFRKVFGSKAQEPPDSVTVYRGVPRADAKLRPGDFVTPDRWYARTYISGKMGAIISDQVKCDDLVVTSFDIDRAEFLYYPRAAMGPNRPSSSDIKPTITFRQFWEETNLESR